MTDLLNDPSNITRCWLVQFWWGNAPHYARYTNFDSDITTPNGNTFSSIGTRLEVKPGRQTGFLKDEPWMITLPSTLHPLDYLVRPYAWAPTYCRIYETNPVASSFNPVTMFSGQASIVKANVGGLALKCEAQISGKRAKIQWPLSIECKTGCSNIFGDAKTCKFPLVTVQQSAVITAVNGYSISAGSLILPSASINGYFTNGTVSVDGLDITIVDATGGVGDLRTLFKPPPEWVGATAVFTPGCDRSTNACNFWGNIAHFNGLGTATPSFDPQLGSRY